MNEPFVLNSSLAFNAWLNKLSQRVFDVLISGPGHLHLVQFSLVDVFLVVIRRIGLVLELFKP